VTTLYYPQGEPTYGAIEIRGAVGKQIVFRVRGGQQEVIPYTIPPNPRTPLQQWWRGVFSRAVEMWHTLTPAQKRPYNRRARKWGRLTGFNYYVSAYLRRQREEVN